mgnify:FL=1
MKSPCLGVFLVAMTPEQKLFYNIAMVGGYFGGYASVRSLVLGSAQTGNLIGIVEMLLGANWMGFFIRVGASVLYAIGVCLTMIVRNHRPQDLKVYSVLLSLIGSGVFLMMPTKMDVILALYPIFFCMSFQWNAFPGACGYVSSSVFSTNNFRQVVLGLTDSHYHPDGDGKRKARFFAGTLVFYHTGVAIGILGIRFFGLHSTWLCMLILLPALYQALRERKAVLEAAATVEQAEHAAAEALAAAQNAPDQAVADADRAIAAAEEAVAEATDAALVEETDAMSEAEVEAADNSQQA